MSKSQVSQKKHWVNPMRGVKQLFLDVFQSYLSEKRDMESSQFNQMMDHIPYH